MPLLDHFRPPAEIRAPWASLGTIWVSKVMAHLNKVLPGDRYLALAKVYLGSEAEADISEFEMPGDWASSNDFGGLATLAAPPVVTIDAAIPDEFEVEVKDTREGMALVAVIEFISPSNKDREESRRQLVSKTKTYLDLGVGVILIDVVTNRSANLHNELVSVLKGKSAARLGAGSTYVAGYRPLRVGDKWTIDMWPYSVPVGSKLPPVPLALKGGPLIPIDLEATYTEACADHRL